MLYARRRTLDEQTAQVVGGIANRHNVRQEQAEIVHRRARPNRSAEQDRRHDIKQRQGYRLLRDINPRAHEQRKRRHASNERKQEKHYFAEVSATNHLESTHAYGKANRHKRRDLSAVHNQCRQEKIYVAAKSGCRAFARTDSARPAPARTTSLPPLAAIRASLVV